MKTCFQTNARHHSVTTTGVHLWNNYREGLKPCETLVSFFKDSSLKTTHRIDMRCVHAAGGHLTFHFNHRVKR